MGSIRQEIPQKLFARLPRDPPSPPPPPLTDDIWAAITQPHVCRPAADRAAQQPIQKFFAE